MRTAQTLIEKPVVVVISANSEWKVVRETYPGVHISRTPFGETFEVRLGRERGVFLQGGWGKISAAASAQYAVDHWEPKALVNIGTCGGLVGKVAKGDLLLAERTLVYDIIEQMTDSAEAIDFYATPLDLTWLPDPYPINVRQVQLLSADRDIIVDDIPGLVAKYDAIAADWESGAIAWVAARNGIRCMILRGVSDLVGVQGGEAYGNSPVFEAGTRVVMRALLESLPSWLINLP